MKKKLSDIMPSIDDAYEALYWDYVIKMQTIPWKYCTGYRVVVKLDNTLMAFDIWEHEEYGFIDTPDGTWGSTITMNTMFDLYPVNAVESIIYLPL